MKGFFRKQTQEADVQYPAPGDLITCGYDSKEAVEEIMTQIEERAFMTSSPITGEPLDAVRLSDIYAVLCEFFDHDPHDSEYSHYA